MMDAELKAKWIADLESGEYRKARGTLVNNSTYCCLGVLACTMSGIPKMGYMDCNDYYDQFISTMVDYSPLTEDEQQVLVSLNDNQSGYPIQWIKDNL